MSARHPSRPPWSSSSPRFAFSERNREPASVEIVGHAAFLDEDPIDHFVFGGAARFPLSPRVSVGTEVVYIIGPIWIAICF